MARRLSLALLASALASCGPVATPLPEKAALTTAPQHHVEEACTLEGKARGLEAAVRTLTEANETHQAEISGLQADLHAYQTAQVPLVPSGDGTYALPLVWSTIEYGTLLKGFRQFASPQGVDDAYIRELIDRMKKDLPTDIGLDHLIELSAPWSPLDSTPFFISGNRAEICAAVLTRAGYSSAVVYKGKETWLLSQTSLGRGISAPLGSQVTYLPVPSEGWDEFAYTPNKTGSPLLVKVVAR